MTNDAKAALRSIIATEERRIVANFHGDSRLALLELVRGMDAYFYYVLSLTGDEAKREHDSERHYLNVYGWNKVLALFLNDRCREHLVPLSCGVPIFHPYLERVDRLSFLDRP